MKIKWYPLFTICLLPILASCSLLSSPVEEKKAPPVPPKSDAVKKIETGKEVLRQLKGSHWVINEFYVVRTADTNINLNFDRYIESKIIDPNHYHIIEDTIQTKTEWIETADDYYEKTDKIDNSYEYYKENQIHYYKDTKSKGEWRRATPTQSKLLDSSFKASLSLDTLLEQAHSVLVRDEPGSDTYSLIFQSFDSVVVEKYGKEKILSILQTSQLIDPGSKPSYSTFSLEVEIYKPTNQVLHIQQTIEAIAPYSKSKGKNGVSVQLSIKADYQSDIHSIKKPSDLPEEKNWM